MFGKNLVPEIWAMRNDLCQSDSVFLNERNPQNKSMK